MSVYIPGMEMPTTCIECFAFKSNASGQLFCKAKRIAFGKDDAEWLPKRTPNWCPLVPVPDHKGPLVDALEVINTFPEEFIFTNEQARAFTNYIIPADKEETE